MFKAGNLIKSNIDVDSYYTKGKLYPIKYIDGKKYIINDFGSRRSFYQVQKYIRYGEFEILSDNKLIRTMYGN